MEQQFEKNKLQLITVRKDVDSMSALLNKMKQLPIISEEGIDRNTAMPLIEGNQLTKLIKEIYNHISLTEDFKIEINMMEKQLEERRQLDVENENNINYYNKEYNELEILKVQYKLKEIMIKKKEEEIAILIEEINKGQLDIDLIKERLDFCSKIFNDYVQSIRGTDIEAEHITTELDQNMQEIDAINNEIVLYKTQNIERSPVDIDKMLQKIEQKERTLNSASMLLERYKKENKYLQQLYGTIRLNSITKVLESLTENFKKTVFRLSANKGELETLRLEMDHSKNVLETKEKKLSIILEKIISHMKTKRISVSNTNGYSSALTGINYFLEIKNLHEENEKLDALVNKIEQKEIDIIKICEQVVFYQKMVNNDLQKKLGTNNTTIKNLKEKYKRFLNEAKKNPTVSHLKSEMESLREDNDNLWEINVDLNKQISKFTNELNKVKYQLACLKINNDEMHDLHADLMQSNADLSHKLANSEIFLKFIRQTLQQIEIEETALMSELGDSPNSV